MPLQTHGRDARATSIPRAGRACQLEPAQDVRCGFNSMCRPCSAWHGRPAHVPGSAGRPPPRTTLCLKVWPDAPCHAGSSKRAQNLLCALPISRDRPAIDSNAHIRSLSALAGILARVDASSPTRPIFSSGGCTQKPHSHQLDDPNSPLTLLGCARGIVHERQRQIGARHRAGVKRVGRESLNFGFFPFAFIGVHSRLRISLAFLLRLRLRRGEATGR